MRKIVLFALFCLSILSLNAQEDYSVHGYFNEFTVDSSYYTFVSDANLRESPSASSKVITLLPIATKVKIINVSEGKTTVNGFEAPFCQVSTTLNGKSVSGYIWAGLLTSIALVSSHDYDDKWKGVIYLLGPASYKDNNLKLQLRIAQNNKELSKLELESKSDVGFYGEIVEVGPDIYENVDMALKVKTGYEACGYPQVDNLIFYMGNKLQKVFSTENISDSGSFYSNEDYLMPWDKGSIANHLLVVKDMAEIEEYDLKGAVKYRNKNQKQSVALYKWNGKALIKLWEK